MDHQGKLLYLIHYLLEESGYQPEIPENEKEQCRLLRALMNIREAKLISEEFLAIQDAYLQEVVENKGVVDVNDLEPIQDRLYVWRGDITRLKVDAIVNACNSGLTGCYSPNHPCIDNIIHTISGVQLRKKCNDIMKIQGYPEPTGQAKITPAYNLPCNYVIHTVGPIVKEILTQEDCDDLKKCYRACMETAEQNNIRSIAFCCLSTGVYGFPQKKASEIATDTVKDYLANGSKIEKVIFNVFTPEDEKYYLKILRKV